MMLAKKKDIQGSKVSKQFLVPKISEIYWVEGREVSDCGE